jgi:hypothetical protein
MSNAERQAAEDDLGLPRGSFDGVTADSSGLPIGMDVIGRPLPDIDDILDWRNTRSKTRITNRILWYC